MISVLLMHIPYLFMLSLLPFPFIPSDSFIALFLTMFFSNYFFFLSFSIRHSLDNSFIFCLSSLLGCIPSTYTFLCSLLSFFFVTFFADNTSLYQLLGLTVSERYKKNAFRVPGNNVFLCSLNCPQPSFILLQVPINPECVDL